MWSFSFCSVNAIAGGILRNVRRLDIQALRIRNYASDPKRFYKNVTITIADGGGYEVNLDNRKLRTPAGTVFKVPNEALATAVAQEWQAQQDLIKRSSMHLTTLCNTAIDNPTKRDSETVANGILEYLQSDTVCFHVDEPESLAAVQHKEWDPLLNWFENRYKVTVEATTGIGMPNIPDSTIHTIKQHLLSYDSWALVGYQNAVESMKSFIIAAALIDRHVSVEQAIFLSRLEQEFQMAKWGNVEWHHEMELHALRARVAAACIFVHLNCEDCTIKDKIKRI